MNPLLLAEEVRAYYVSSRGFIKAVDGVTLSIEYGDILGLAGESGCGKSTLSNVLIMNVRPPLKFMGGKIILDGAQNLTVMRYKELKSKIWGRVVALIPQSALNALVPTIKVQDFINDVLRVHHRLSQKEATSLARQRFQEIGLPIESLSKYPHQLSGGMRQRVVIAAVTLLQPKLLIADEPTSALDVSTQKQVLKMLMLIHREQIVKSIVVITHDIAVLRQIATKIGVMYAGKLVEIASAERLLRAPLHPYTCGLIQCVITPEPEVKNRDLVYISGAPPDLVQPPSGCRFHPRCSYSKDICTREEPLLTALDEAHAVACHFANG